MNDLQTTIRVHGAEGWKILWENNQTSWNIDDSAPPLREVFDLGLLDSLPSGAKARALVPGCGEVKLNLLRIHKIPIEPTGT